MNMTLEQKDHIGFQLYLRCREYVGREFGLRDDIFYAQAGAVSGRVDVGEAAKLRGLKNENYDEIAMDF